VPLTNSTTRKMMTRASAMTATLAAGAASLILVAAAGGAAPPVPSGGSASINGNANEWTLTGSGNNWFSSLEYEADGAVEGNLYLRYSCLTNELFAHVRSAEGTQLDNSVDPEDHFLRLGSTGPALVDGSDAASGDFAFIDEDADGVDDGWEARAVVAVGTYSELQVVARVRKDADTTTVYNAAPKGWHIPLDVSCKKKKNDDKGGSEGAPPGGGQSTPPATPPSTPGTPSGSPSTPASPRTPTTTRKPRRPWTKLVSRKRGTSRVTAGRAGRYTLRVTNRGKRVARKVVIRDVLPQGMVLVRRPKGATIKGRTVIWRIKRIAPKRTVKRTLRVRLLRNSRGKTCNRMVTTAVNAAVTRSKKCTRVTRVNNARPFIPAVTG